MQKKKKEEKLFWFYFFNKYLKKSEDILIYKVVDHMKMSSEGFVFTAFHRGSS